MTTLLDIQRALHARGFDPGPFDGLPGPSTFDALMDALAKLPAAPVAPAKAPTAAAPATALVPLSWMPWAQMARIIVHWTAGQHEPSEDDRKHYHVLIKGDGTLVRGRPSIDLNQAPPRKGYAAHTLNCNSGSIGVSLCGMAGAVEEPFAAGKQPLTPKQWAALPVVLADLCRRYAIPVTPATVLSHAEVQDTLKIRQRGKWDIARLPFDPSVKGACAVGDVFRKAASAALVRV